MPPHQPTSQPQASGNAGPAAGASDIRPDWPDRIDATSAALAVDMKWIAYLDRQPWEDVQAWQGWRLGELLYRAAEHSTWWRAHLGCLTGRNDIPLADLPVIGREEYRASIGAAAGSLPLPPEHGRTLKSSTSGSSGVPVEFYSSALCARLAKAEWRYDDIRQGRDPARLRAELASRRVPQHSADHIVLTGDPLIGTGDTLQRRVASFTVEDHARWLSRARPAYLSVAPELLGGMLDFYENGAIQPPQIEQIMTFAETVDSSVRARARAVLGASIRDRYSCEEIGPIAFQCPASDDHYHLASSNVVVEVLDESGGPCQPGVLGRVVVTGLHNWASPAIRYELNDMAAWQPTCACGRHAPVLVRLLGRKRFLIRLPSGDRKAPRISAKNLLALAPVREHRLVQVSETSLHAELVVQRSLTERERQSIIAMLQREISPDLTYEIRQVEKIDWGPTYKRQDVISLL